MTRSSYRLKSKQLLFIALLALFFLVLFFVMLELLQVNEKFSLSKILRETMISYPFLLLLALFMYKIILRINENPYFKKHFAQRVFTELVAGIALSFLLVFVGNLVIIGPSVIDSFFTNYLLNTPGVAAIFINLMMTLLLEFFILYDQQRIKEIEIADLKSQNSEYLYNLLRSQINPHFLFNSLNNLSALIYKNQEHAMEFTKKLSNVYRYVLNYDREELIQIRKELDFAHTYVNVLKVRFADNLSFNYTLNADSPNRQIPPMTLQLLIENAVKHNVVSANKKLFIHVKNEGNYLLVENNKNPLQSPDLDNSIGLGLKNLNNRFKLALQQPIEIIESENQFIVKLPMA